MSNKIPASLTALTAVNVIYGLVAAIIVGLSSFEVDLWTSIVDNLEGNIAQRRDNIELATIIFLALSAVIGLAFFFFYKQAKDLKSYYFNFIIVYSLLFASFATLTGLQFYYCSNEGGGDDTYEFTRWWPLASLVLTLAIIMALFRFRKLV